MTTIFAQKSLQAIEPILRSDRPHRFAALTVLPLNCYNLDPSFRHGVSCLTENQVAEASRRTNQDEKERE